MIGMLVKSLPLRLQLEVEQRFEGVVRQVQQHIAELDRYQDVPELFRRETFFDLIMTYQDTRFSLRRPMHLDGAILRSIELETSYSRIPWQFNFFEVESTLQLRLSYDSGLYDADSAGFLVGLLRQLLILTAEEPELEVGQLERRLVQAAQEEEELDFDLHF
ncbi:MAG: hypothetical protein KDC44_25355, partial [Phaeodactylibacter sp.]|nr:hypothetical protein [Phaeodactylibacter sp.]